MDREEEVRRSMLVSDALELPETEQRQFIIGATTGNSPLRNELLSLVSSYQGASAIFVIWPPTWDFRAQN